jgi:tetratricopeptide (TPR) repeat protein
MRFPIQRVLLYLVILLAGFLRIIYLRELRLDDPFFNVPVVDSATYHAWAQRIAAGDLLGSGVFYLAPGYPYFLGAVYRIFGVRFDVVYILQMAMDLGIILALWGITRAAFGEPAGLVAAVLWTFFRFAPFYAGKMSAETPGAFWLVMSVWVIMGALERGSWRRAVGAGLLMGLAIVTRAFLLLMLPLLCLAILGTRGFSRRGAVTVGLLLGAALVIFTVTFRNLIVTGHWTLISANSGIVLYAGNNPDARGFPTHLEGISSNVDEQWIEVQGLVEEEIGRRPTPGDVDAYWRKKVWAFVREKPMRFIALLLRKALLSISDEEFSDMYFAAYEKERFIQSLGAFWLTMAVVVPAGLMGIMRSSGSSYRWILLCPVITIALVLLIFSVTERYRFLSTPFLCVFASLAVTRMRGGWRPWLLVFAVAAWMIVDARVLGLERKGFPPEVHYNTGYAFLQRGELESAVEEFERALKLRPHYPEALLNMGNALYAMGREEEAVALWERSLRERPDYPLALYNLAVVLEDRDPERARRYWEAYRRAEAQRGRPSKGLHVPQ